MVQILSHEFLSIDNAAKQQVRSPFSVLLNPVSNLFIDSMKVSADIGSDKDPGAKAWPMEKG